MELLGLKMTKIGVSYTEEEDKVDEDILTVDPENDMNEEVEDDEDNNTSNAVTDCPPRSPASGSTISSSHSSEIFYSGPEDERQEDDEHAGGHWMYEEEVGEEKKEEEDEEESERLEVDHEVPEGDCVEVEAEAEEIQDYQVVWARAKGWPWWPGVVSQGTKRRWKNVLRTVEFFGRDDRGRNTHAELVSGPLVVFSTLIQSFLVQGEKNIKPFLGREEKTKYEAEVKRMYSNWGGQLEEWRASVEGKLGTD